MNKVLREMIRSICFSGGGYQTIYQLGVVYFIHQNKNKFSDYHYTGASAGATIASLCFVNNFDINNTVYRIKDHCYEFRNKSYYESLTHGTNKSKSMVEHITSLISSDTIDKMNGRLHVSLTRFPFMKNIIVNQFKNKKEFYDIMRATCCVPGIFDKKPYKINNEWYVDGGLTNNSPILNSNTLIIHGNNQQKSFIAPSKKLETNTMMKYIGPVFVPSNEEIDQMIEIGYQDIVNAYNKNPQLFDQSITLIDQLH